MKTNSLLIILVLILFACSNEPEKSKDGIIIATENKPSKFSFLDKLFKQITTDTFYVYSDQKIDDPDHKFKGVLMDSIQVSLLPNEIKSKYAYSKDFFACYKFSIDSSKIGLIIRVPGEYVSSALKLFIFDLKKDSITNYYSAADIFGDAGYFSALTSCIFKTKEKKAFVVSYNWAINNEVSGAPEDSAINFTENWKNYYLFDLSKNQGDTVSKDSATIVKLHPEIIKKMMN